MSLIILILKKLDCQRKIIFSLASFLHYDSEEVLPYDKITAALLGKILLKTCNLRRNDIYSNMTHFVSKYSEEGEELCTHIDMEEKMAQPTN